MELLLQAAQPLLAPVLELWGSPVTWLELLAVALSLVMVVCNVRVDATAWPLAISASLLYFVLFWHSRLYGEASLQLFFVVVASWGWWQWLRGRTAEGTALHVRWLSRRSRWRLLLAVAIAWPLLGSVLLRATDSDVPWWDALPTAGSLAGQWLLGRKYVENWLTWAAVNAVSVGLFAWKGLWLTVLLYALFLLMSLWGWREWARLAAAGSTR
ncbi:MAG TPA: nicotinamide riboside transporter PnuC [Rubrivivax sp.]|nr:nicotinamide riboside transporter PnuC [Rubrivivax sp.]HPO19601.1 nicotinamide riboside transporter PnuC [Rubrivivax sp.]